MHIYYSLSVQSILASTFNCSSPSPEQSRSSLSIQTPAHWHALLQHWLSLLLHLYALLLLSHPLHPHWHVLLIRIPEKPADAIV